MLELSIGLLGAGIFSLALAEMIVADAKFIRNVSVLNPVTAAIAMIILGFVDFSRAGYNTLQGTSLSLGGYTISDDGASSRATIVYAIASLAMLTGIYLPRLVSRSVPRWIQESKASGRSRFPAIELACFAIMCAVAASIWMYLRQDPQNQESIFAVSTFRRFWARDNPFLAVASALFVPAYAVLMSRVRPLSTTAASATIISSLLVLLLLGRGSLLLVIVIALLCLGKEFKLRFIYIVIGAIAFLFLFDQLRVYQREWAPTADVVSESYDGFIARLFDSPEIALAEPLIILAEQPNIRRGPFDTLLSGLLLPIPRAIYPEKPLPPSTFFTMNIDNFRWVSSGSELTVTMLGDLFMSFGYFTPVLSLIMGLGISLYSLRWTRIFPASYSVAMLAYGIIVVVGAFRGDLFLVFFNVWQCLIVFALLWSIQLVVRASGIRIV